MDKKISNIVFTKNRPLQLHAYLESFYKHFSVDLTQTYLLYKPELFQKEYKELFSSYPDCKVIEESDFSNDFLRILSQIDTKYILFGIDDVVYYDSVDFGVIDNVFENYPDEAMGFSLRIGKSIVQDGDKIDDVNVNEQMVHRVNWTVGQSPNTKYPFELCATIYRTSVVKKVISSAQNQNAIIRKLFSPGSSLVNLLSKVVSVRRILRSFGYFYNPNTLESWNCRWCQGHSEELPGYLYFQKLCASAIQVNIVNTSTVNETDGSAELTVEKLAEKYREGYRFDICALKRDKPSGPHCGKECFGLVKSETK
jgi:hypothetical protein